MSTTETRNKLILPVLVSTNKDPPVQKDVLMTLKETGKKSLATSYANTDTWLKQSSQLWVRLTFHLYASDRQSTVVERLPEPFWKVSEIKQLSLCKYGWRWSHDPDFVQICAEGGTNIHLWCYSRLSAGRHEQKLVVHENCTVSLTSCHMGRRLTNSIDCLMIQQTNHWSRWWTIEKLGSSCRTGSTKG